MSSCNLVFRKCSLQVILMPLGLKRNLAHAFLSSLLSLSLSIYLFVSLSLCLSLSPCTTGRVSVKDWRLLFFSIAMASNDTSPPRKERTTVENYSDDEFDEIETVCEKVVEFYNNEKKAEEARKIETRQMSAAKFLLPRVAENLYRHRPRIARHGRVDRDRLEKLVEQLAALPEEEQEGTASTVGKEPFNHSYYLVKAAVNGFVELITILCQRERVKESEMRHAARVAFLFRRNDVIQAFAQLGVDMGEDVFLADVLALKKTHVSGLIPFGAPSNYTAAQETRSYLELLKAALGGDQTQVVQCLDKVGSTGVQTAGSPWENEDENVNWMECHGRVFCNDNWAPTKKDAVINIAILVTIARGNHQALRVLLDQAGPTWKDVTVLKKPVCIAQFDATPTKLAVLSGCVHTVQVLLDQVQSLSAFPEFLHDAMMHARLDVGRYLVKKEKALINGAGDAYGDFHRLFLKNIHCVLFSAIEVKLRWIVKFVFKEFKRGELLFDDVDDAELDQLVQDSKSLSILRALLLWCPDYVKNQLQIEPNLAEVWPLGYRCLLDAKGKLENRIDIPESSDSEDELQLG